MKENMKGWSWKSYVAGMATSFVLVGLVGGAIAYSASQVSFNMVNIGTGSSTLATKGNDYRLENGSYVPYSITYTDERGGGTVYLPIRKISEFTQTSVSWDAATNHVIVNVDTTEAYNNAIGKGGSYQDGYNDGYADGSRNNGSSGSYNSGYNDGYDDGYAAGKKVNTSNGDYQTGYNDGYTVGYNAGKGAAGGSTTDRYQEGYDAGFSAGKAQGVTEGEKTGYDKGLSDGKESGYQEGYEDGYADGKGGATEHPNEPDGGEGQKPENEKYYNEFPNVPNFGLYAGEHTLDVDLISVNKKIAYNYIGDNCSEGLEKYEADLLENGFTMEETPDVYGDNAIIYKKDGVQLTIGIKADLIGSIYVYQDEKFDPLLDDFNKAKINLITVSNQRDVYAFVNGTWQWIADPAKVQAAQQQLDEVQAEIDEYLAPMRNTLTILVEKI